MPEGAWRSSSSNVKPARQVGGFIRLCDHALRIFGRINRMHRISFQGVIVWVKRARGVSFGKEGSACGERSAVADAMAAGIEGRWLREEFAGVFLT